MSQYHFSITISGNGDDPAEAWTDACEGFAFDPGDYDPEETVKVEDE